MILLQKLKKAGNIEGIIDLNYALKYPALELEHFTPPIVEISPTISRLTHLRLINLWKNRIRTLPDAFTELHALQTCLLHFNEFYKMPPQLFKLTNLERLTLRGNNVTEIPSEISALMNLTFFSARQNRITQLPPAIFKLTNLQSLLLARNDIFQVSALMIIYFFNISIKMQIIL
jgi:Leucine-rich repeat (LRR) protein